MKKHAVSLTWYHVLLIYGLLFATACAVNPVTGKKELMFMSEEQEVTLGKQADPEIVATYGLYQDPELQRFIDARGQEMAKISHRSHLQYHFKILDSPVVNAFALPGGYVYFTRGILAHFNNEAEFAGVLGHEIGHITARHGASQQSKATLSQLLLIGGMLVSPTFRQFASESQQLLQLMFLKFGRDDEAQSDELGVEYSTEIGYNSHEMADFFQTLHRMRVESGAQALPTFLSTHPDPYDRYEKVHALSEEAQEGLDVTSLKVNRRQYLQMIDGLIYGQDPKQGYVEQNRFYHPELKFTFPIPNGWQTVNTPSRVQIAPENGEALLMLTLMDETSLEAAARAVINNYGLTEVDRARRNRNNMETLAILAEQSNQQTGQSIRVLTYLIHYNHLIYAFHGVAEQANYARYLPTFEGSMNHFTVLTDPSKINKKAQRLQIRSASQSGTLQQLLSRDGIPKDKMGEIALLNGLTLEDQVSEGDLYKIFR